MNFYKTHKELKKSKGIEKPKHNPRTRARQQNMETEDVHIDTSNRYEDTSSDEKIEIIKHVPVHRDEIQGSVIHRDEYREMLYIEMYTEMMYTEMMYKEKIMKHIMMEILQKDVMKKKI